jgi:hypothetical protein
MMHFLASVILGIVIPVIGFVTLEMATDLMNPSALTKIAIFDESAPGLLLAPFSLPIYFSIWVRYARILPDIFDTFVFRATSIVLFNWLLYGLIMYFLLGRLKWFRRQNNEASSLPPRPPRFD